jgi:hypothetical protein
VSPPFFYGGYLSLFLYVSLYLCLSVSVMAHLLQELFVQDLSVLLSVTHQLRSCCDPARPPSRSPWFLAAAVAGIMADSTDMNSKGGPPICISGIVTAAMAWRVKYRKLDDNGKVVRKHIPIQNMGVHPRNRGGIYPAGIRCKSLCQELLTNGFLKEECNHVGIAVEEVPYENVIQRGPDYQSMRCFNVVHSSKDELLSSCFDALHDDVRAGLLAHNHVMLVLRAFLTGAKWDMRDETSKGIIYCDDAGRLSIPAVAAHNNAREMEQVLNEGLFAEILSWKMDLEEPTAASIISQALNKGHAMALHTTEITAVAVLKGEMIAQMSKDVGQQVAFATVKERVRSQLDNAVDDPDFVEVFDFLISVGVGKNSYVDHLLEFASQFVDSKKRQLRLGSFAEVNKVCANAPRTKVALIKRAYRKKPTNGFCPSPEPVWGTFDWDELKYLEGLLRYFHVTCKHKWEEKLKPQSRAIFLANVDVAATDAFYAARPSAGNKHIEKTKKAIIGAVVKYAESIGLREDKPISTTDSWIEFEWGQCDTTQDPVAQDPVAPKVIEFDETTGTCLTSQIEFKKKEEKQETGAIPLPWREWRSTAEKMGAKEADHAIAVVALQHLHAMFYVEDESIDVMSMGDKVYVCTIRDVEKHSICLPPCIPRQSKVFEKTEHPNAVKVVIKTLRKDYVIAQGSESAVAAKPKDAAGAALTKETALAAVTKPDAKAPKAAQGKLQFPTEKTETAKDEGKSSSSNGNGSVSNVIRETSFYVLPEFKSPVDKRTPTQMKEEESSPSWHWGEGGAETMHPFWAVRRITATQLRKEQEAKKIGQPQSRFNCELIDFQMSLVSIAAPKNQ